MQRTLFAITASVNAFGAFAVSDAPADPPRTGTAIRQGTAAPASSKNARSAPDGSRSLSSRRSRTIYHHKAPRSRRSAPPAQPSRTPGHTTGHHHHPHHGRRFRLYGFSPHGSLGYELYAPSYSIHIVPPYGYGVFGPGYYGPTFGSAPYGAGGYPQPPPWIGGDPSFHNEPLRDAWRENEHRWGGPVRIDAASEDEPQFVEPSTPEMQLKSLRLQQRADRWFRKQEYLQAYDRYKQSIAAAEDRPEPQFRLALTLTALGRYSLAVKHIKRGLELEPSWPITGESLDKLFGPENALAKTSVIHRVAHWVRQDIRDPDRLFLMGVLLHFNRDTDQSGPFFEAAYRLAGEGDHLVAFLNPKQPDQQPSADQPTGQTPQPPPEVPPSPRPPSPDEPSSNRPPASEGPEFPRRDLLPPRLPPSAPQ